MFTFYRQQSTIWQGWRRWGTAFVVGLLWSGLLVGCAASPASTPVIESTDAPTPTVVATPTLEPTLTPIPSTDTPIPSSPTPTDMPAPTATPLPPTATPLPPTDTPAPVEEPQISFAGDVQPILERRCLKCHGGDRVENDFSVENYEAVMKGSWNGVVVEPGDVGGSYLLDLVVSGDMPKRGPRLLPAEIEAIRAWIEAGAPNN